MTKNLVKFSGFALVVLFAVSCAPSKKPKTDPVKQDVKVVKQDVKTDDISPEELDSMIEKEVKRSPSMAIRIEKYASEEVKKEMAQLRQEANVAQLLRQKNEINALKEQNSFLSKENIQLLALQHDLRREKEQISQQVSQLSQERDQFKELSDSYQQKISVLEGKVSALKKEQEDIRIAKEEKKVPVLLDSEYMDTVFRIVRKTTGEIFLYRVQNALNGQKIVELPPGEYTFEVSKNPPLSGVSTAFSSPKDFRVSEKPITVISNPTFTFGGYPDIPAGEPVQLHAVVKYPQR